MCVANRHYFTGSACMQIDIYCVSNTALATIRSPIPKTDVAPTVHVAVALPLGTLHCAENPRSAVSRPLILPALLVVNGNVNVTVVVHVPMVAIVTSNSTNANLLSTCTHFAELTVNVAVPQVKEGVKVDVPPVAVPPRACASVPDEIFDALVVSVVAEAAKDTLLVLMHVITPAFVIVQSCDIVANCGSFELTPRNNCPLVPAVGCVTAALAP